MKLFWLLTILFPLQLLAQDAGELVSKAVDHWRDTSSYTEAEMTIVRPDWTRKMQFKAWTKGRDLSLVKFIYPPKDAGSASLTKNNNSWSYSPKINKVIKIPPSMMTQSWMGSDFSYQDLSKADDIIENYNHQLVKTEAFEGFKTYTVESTPKADAPVVWGKEIIVIRQDYIILQHDYFDQSGKLIKSMQASEISSHQGKSFAKRLKINQLEEAGKYTEVYHSVIEFGLPIDDNFFNLP